MIMDLPNSQVLPSSADVNHQKLTIHGETLNNKYF